MAESAGLSWGVLTNGQKWRLYSKHDVASAYFEFDLVAAIRESDEEQAALDLARFLVLFGREAFVRTDGVPHLDELRESSVQARAELEDELRGQVFEAVEQLADGYISHPDNGLGLSDLPRVYEACLLLLYRILFVLNAEARGLLPTTKSNDREREFFAGYGLALVRDKLRGTSSRVEYGSEYGLQLDARLRGLFQLISGAPPADGRTDANERQGVPRYNGGLFDPVRHAEHDSLKVGDRTLARVLELLCFRLSGQGDRDSIDYANLGERHLGSIYEGLLEHRLVALEGRVELIDDKGERRSQGAYFTPHDLVQLIVENTLSPLLARIEAGLAPGNPDEPDDGFGEAVLQLKVCDPAMGSGHFSVEVVSFLAEAVASHPTTCPRPVLKTDGQPRL